MHSKITMKISICQAQNGSSYYELPKKLAEALKKSSSISKEKSGDAGLNFGWHGIMIYSIKPRGLLVSSIEYQI